VLGLKLVVSLLTVLPPTILMGGTLPVLVKTVSETVEEFGEKTLRYSIPLIASALSSGLFSAAFSSFTFWASAQQWLRGHASIFSSGLQHFSFPEKLL